MMSLMKSADSYSLSISLAGFLMFIYGLNLFNCYFYVSLVVAVLCFLYLLNRKIQISLQALFVFAFLLFYCLLSLMINNENRLELVFQCMVFYCFGATYGNRKNLFKLVACGTAGFGLYGVISSFRSVLDSGRYLQDVWGGGRLAATQVAAWCMVYMAFVPWLVFKKSIGRFLKVKLYCLTGFSVISFFILSSRTGLIVIVFILFLVFFISIREKQSKILTSLIAFFFATFFAYTFDFAGIRTAFWNSNLVLRMIQKQSAMGSAFSTGRIDRWVYVLTHFGDNLCGGYQYSSQLGGMIHNFFLDLYDECGLLPLLLMIIVVARLIYGMVCVGRHSNSICLEDKVGLISWFVIILILFLSEPVLYYGRTNLMAFFFFMIALVELNGPLAYREEVLDR